LLEKLDDRCLLSGLPPGSLDPTFGTGTGFVLDPALQSPKATVVLPDKSILVGSSAGSPTAGTNFVIRKYTPSGTLDRSFGSGGQVVTDFYGKNDQLEQLVVDTSKNLVYAVGEATTGTTQVGIGVARYSLGGQLDPSFGVGGKAVTPILTGYPKVVDQAETAMLDPQGRLLVGGMTSPSDLKQTYTANFMVRYGAQNLAGSGSLDPTFGNSGAVVGKCIAQNGSPGLGAPDECWNAMAYIPAGSGYKILTIGTNECASAMCQFSDTGVMTDLKSMSGPIGAIAFTHDMSSYVSVSTVNGGATRNDIQIDTYSVANGKEIRSITIDLARDLHVAQSAEAAAAVAMDAQGRIVVAGSVTGYNLSGGVVLDKALLMRFTATGQRDATFGTMGVVTTDFGLGKDTFTHVVIQSDDGKILATGATTIQPLLIVARYLGEPQVIGSGGGSGVAGVPVTLPTGPLVTIDPFASPVKKARGLV
jgi:uncharacterized delta-60 repeat protein